MRQINVNVKSSKRISFVLNNIMSYASNRIEELWYELYNYIEFDYKDKMIIINVLNTPKQPYYINRFADMSDTKVLNFIGNTLKDILKISKANQANIDVITPFINTCLENEDNSFDVIKVDTTLLYNESNIASTNNYVIYTLIKNKLTIYEIKAAFMKNVFGKLDEYIIPKNIFSVKPIQINHKMLNKLNHIELTNGIDSLYYITTIRKDQEVLKLFYTEYNDLVKKEIQKLHEKVDPLYKKINLLELARGEINYNYFMDFDSESQSKAFYKEVPF